MLTEQSSHRQWAIEKIQDIIEDFEVRPILFIGSGFSQRYLDDAPNWDQLLRHMIQQCPDEYINRPFEYYNQQYSNPRIGTEIADGYAEWAWDVRETDEFPDYLYDIQNREVFLKYKVSRFFDDISPDNIEDVDKNQDELEILKEIGPHAVVTTNYDSLVETIFPDEYNLVIGEDIYDLDYTSIGEIFKIHGCLSKPQEIVLTQRDYMEFIEKKRYLTAKLLTYFAEHPVIIIGYDATDENITRILEDVDLVTSEEIDESDLIENIFHLDWSPGISDGDQVENYKIILGDDNQRIRIRSISAEDYSWIYDAVSHRSEMTGVKVEALRNILNNTYSIVSEDAPKKKIQLEMMEQVSEKDELSTLLGVTPMDRNTEQGDLLRRYLRSRREDQYGDDPSVEDRLEVATLSWSLSDTTIDSAREIIEYRQCRDEFELNKDRINTLFRSSLSSGLQGIDWIAEIDDFSEPLETASKEVEDHRSAMRLEYNLLVLGEPEYLDNMIQNIGGEYSQLHLEDFRDRCSRPLQERLEAYAVPSTAISFVDERLTTPDLLGNPEKTEELLSRLSNIMLSEDSVSDHKSDFKKLELAKLANMVQQEEHSEGR
jgi:hypothetical protein